MTKIGAYSGLGFDSRHLHHLTKGKPMQKKHKHLDMYRSDFSDTTPKAVERHVEGWKKKGYRTVTVRVNWLYQVIQHYKGLQKSKNKALRKAEDLQKKLDSRSRTILRKSI